MIRRILLAVLRATRFGIALASLPMLATTAAPKDGPKDTLVIGMAQFPSSLNPDVNAEVAKYYALGFALRPITAYDKDWHNTCLLCTDLPTLENGLAKMETRPDGTQGMAVTIKLKPDLKWGDGQPVTARDILFTWKLASSPASGFSNPHAWGRAADVDVVDDQTAVLHLKRVEVSYASWDQLLPEHIEGPIIAKGGDGAAYLKNTGYDSAPDDAGLVERAIPPHRLPDRAADRLRAQPQLVRHQARVQANHAQAVRDDRGAASEPALGRCGHGCRGGGRADD